MLRIIKDQKPLRALLGKVIIRSDEIYLEKTIPTAVWRIEQTGAKNTGEH